MATSSVTLELPDGYDVLIIPSGGASRICVEQARKEMQKGRDVRDAVKWRFGEIKKIHKEIEKINSRSELKQKRIKHLKVAGWVTLASGMILLSIPLLIVPPLTLLSIALMTDFIPDVFVKIKKNYNDIDKDKAIENRISKIEEYKKEIEDKNIDEQIEKINKYEPTLAKHKLTLEDVKWTIWDSYQHKEIEWRPSYCYPTAQMVVNHLTEFNEDYDQLIKRHNEFINENNLKTENKD